MEQRQFGRTDMRVSALGFGGSEIGSLDDAATVQRLLESALDAGLNVVDTGACYGASEELIGSAVSHRRGDFYLFTKCGHAAGLDTPDWDPATVRDSIDRSLRRLKTDHIDLMQLHSCSVDVLARGDLLEVLERAQTAGKVRYLGYSGDREGAVYAVESGRFAALQTSCNIADQSVLPVIALAESRGMGVIAKRPLANVAWRHETLPTTSYSYPYWERLAALRYPFLAGPLEQAVATALRFTLSVPGVATAIVGTRSPGRWQQNADYVALGPLAPDQYEAIRKIWLATAGPDWVGKT